LINAVNNDVPGFAGIIIIAICTLMVTFFGYKIVHVYEFWSWIPTTIVFIIILGVFAHSGDFVNIPMGMGTSELGSVLSFGSVVYGFATGWTSYAADYTVYQPSSQSRIKVFFAVWIGLIIPLLFTEMLGIAIMTATTINEGKNKYADGYAASGTGGLLGAVLFGPLGGFGKFCLIILSLSIIANNCPNIYSVGLTIQVLGGRWTQRVPRFVWTAVGTAIYIAIAIPGYTHFESVLENFMNFIGKFIFSKISNHVLIKIQATGSPFTRALPSAITSCTSAPWQHTTQPSTTSLRNSLLVSQPSLGFVAVSQVWSLE
jgi:purine-cytosine permease-like protein